MISWPTAPFSGAQQSMIDREDGPIKHYRMVCDLCGKKTKRFVGDFSFKYDAPKGWKEFEDDYDYVHHCPKCALDAKQEGVKEIVPNVDDSADISDHESVCRPLIRKSVNALVIDLSEGCQWVITSDTPIKVEQYEE
jgi:hypothetical protein